MKIGKKLMISNIFITLITMIILTIVISSVVSNYIERDIKEEIVKENQILVKWLSYDKFLKYIDNNIYVYLSEYEKFNELPTFSAVFNLDNPPKLLDIAPNKFKYEFTEEEIYDLLNRDLKDVYSIRINGKPYLAYNDVFEVSFDDKDYTLLVSTLLPNELMNEITEDMIKILISAILIISILLIVFTRYYERMITSPIKELVCITEKIGKKKFDQKVNINTGDEFETLAVAINNMADNLKKQDIEQKKFYENLSHEIKTPLTVISGYAQGIKTNIFEDSDKALDIIVNESNRLKKQLENVIYLSKLDTVNEFYNIEKASLNELIGSALQKLDSVIIINEIDIVFEPKDDVILNVDRQKITRAFINILSNCVKYTKDTISINVEKSEDWVRIEVSDNGDGFSPELLENPFGRTIIGKKEGSGIGLSIIKKVIDGHNGIIGLSNNKEGGAVYIVELPL